MEASSVPSSSGHMTTAPQSLLHVLMLYGDDVIMSLLDKKLYICVHKVAMMDGVRQELFRILEERISVSDVVVCEVVDLNDMVVHDLMEEIKSKVNIPIKLVPPDSPSARVLNRTSDACRYTLNGHMKYIVEKKIVDQQMKHFRSKSVGSGGDHATRISEITVTSNVDQANIDSSNNRSRRRRVVWTSELHRAFVDAVHKLGVEKAVPKKILELMNMPDLTRENVASHLQKYRLYLKKRQNTSQVQQDELSSRKRQNSISNPTIGISTSATPFKLSSWPEPELVKNSQLNSQNWDPSNLTFMEGPRSFDCMDDPQLGPYGAYHASIGLQSEFYGCELPHGAFPYAPYENNGEYGFRAELEMLSTSFNCVHDDVAKYWTDESMNREFFTESKQTLYDQMTSQDYVEQHQNNCVRDDGVATCLNDEPINRELLFMGGNQQLLDQMTFEMPRGYVMQQQNKDPR